MSKVDLSIYDNSWYKPGPKLKRVSWYIVNTLVFDTYFSLGSGFKRAVLRFFGAKIGKGVIIKPKVNIKYPWNLEVDNHSWIGEGVWIDCLDKVIIGKNACISQGALLLSGNHDYKKVSFDLIIDKIVIEDGVWIGAKSIVTLGVTCKSHAVLATASVASKDLESYGVYSGNPAIKVRERSIEK
ncbi:MAG: WcaF family extracellular polysaccharide biosynthesis acetyltransferase [Flavobacteriales bacterium]|nr:WcaF family extracellular polysaccharide biosynthesis acetyltransferase [Flavobacteriales bacterium]